MEKAKEALAMQLASARTTLEDEDLWNVVERKVNALVDMPVVPEALEATAFDRLGDALRAMVLEAIAELEAELLEDDG